MTEFGYKRASNTADDLRFRLMQSPTGRQLAIDGNFVHAVQDTDPAIDPAFLPPDGTTLMWKTGVSLYQSTFTRDTGWVQVQLT